MCVGSLAGVIYLRYTVLTRSKKAETVVHCCDPALSVLVVLVPRNVFHVVSALQSIARIQDCYKVIVLCCVSGVPHTGVVTTSVVRSRRDSSTQKALLSKYKLVILICNYLC